MKLQELNQADSKSQFFQTRKEIKDWMKLIGVTKYTINSTSLTVDVEQGVNITNASIAGLVIMTRMLPVQFNTVTRSFSCADLELVTLKGAPQHVGGEFSCGYNHLTSLEGGPKTVNGDYVCFRNLLTSLEHAPVSVTGNFKCTSNEKMTSLHNIHRHIKSIDGTLIIGRSIKSHILGVFRIKNLRNVIPSQGNPVLNNVLEIINNNLQGKGNIHIAQEQLLDAGLKEFAQL